jgi:hypothetical protein
MLVDGFDVLDETSRNEVDVDEVADGVYSCGEVEDM